MLATAAVALQKETQLDQISFNARCQFPFGT